MSKLEFLTPDWPAPPQVHALITTRNGGVSAPPYASFNLAAHVGDDPAAVAENRRILRQLGGLPAEPHWLTQVHGCDVTDCAGGTATPEADAAFADRPARVCAVLTADCLPVLFCNRSGTRVAAAHAGWRGLAGGVLEAALGRFPDPPEQLLAWMGPAIGPAVFEVGPEVRDAFAGPRPQDTEAFRASPGGGGHWLADLYRLAYNRLRDHGVGWIGGGAYCTFTEAERFYSFRRDGDTGRMASLIWIE